MPLNLFSSIGRLLDHKEKRIKGTFDSREQTVFLSSLNASRPIHTRESSRCHKSGSQECRGIRQASAVLSAAYQNGLLDRTHEDFLARIPYWGITEEALNWKDQ